MSDLGTRLRQHLDEVAPPLDTERLIDQFVGADRYRQRLRPVMVMIATALLTLVVIGMVGVMVLGGTGEPDVIDPLPPTSVTTTLPDTAATTTVTPPSGAWTPILTTTQAKPAPPTATCPPGADPNTPGPAAQERPSARFNWDRRAVFDRHAGRIVYVDVAGDTWTFDVCTSTWQNMHPAGAPAGAEDMVYDVDSDVTVAFGYQSVSVYDANTNAWTQLDNDTGSRGLAYDPLSGLILTTDFVGSDSRFPASPARWQLRAYDVDANQWFQVADIELDEFITGPNGIEGFFWGGELLGYSEKLDRLIITPGGEGETTVLLDPRTGDTTLVATPTPYINLGWPSGIHVRAADTVYVKDFEDASICGFDTTTLTWSACYELPHTSGRRTAFVELVGDPINQRLIVINGVGSDPPYEATSDVWAIDLNTNEWTLLLAAGTEETNGKVFTPANDDLCERIEPTELTRIVSEVYTEYGAAPGPQPFEVSWDSNAYQGCAWKSSEENDDDATGIGLIFTEPAGWYEQWVEIDEYFHPHAGLSDRVRVGGALGQPPIQVGRPGDWTPGIEVRLLVEGQDRTVEYWVSVPVGFEGNAEPLLAIADNMLQLMGWLPHS